MKSILVCSAHNDDFVLGCGGTIAKYVSEGYTVHTVIFSYGVSSHPWLKPEVIKKTREREAIAAAKLLGTRVSILDCRELHYKEDFPRFKHKIENLIHRLQPEKIFIHSSEDPHPDHRAVNIIMKKIIPKKSELYVYSVWNPISIKTGYPSLIISVRKTFSKKLAALKLFKSQKVHVAMPVVLLLWHNILDGIRHRHLIAEKFYRIQ